MSDEIKEPAAEYSKHYTYADYLNFTFEEMVEIIKGKLVKMSPAPKRIHQDLSGRLFLQIGSYLKNKKCKVYHAPFDVVLPLPNKTILQSDRIVQPDISVICNPEILDEKGCHGVPDWIIEILSPGSQKHDIQVKYDLYEEAGVGEYWITDPINECIEVFVLQNGKYQRIGTYFKDDMVQSHTLKELSIDLNEIFIDENKSNV